MSRRPTKSDSQVQPSTGTIDPAEQLRLAIERLRAIATRGYISDEPAVDPTELSIAERLALLDQLMPPVGGVAASEHVRRLFPEVAAREHALVIKRLPATAPELWAKDRQDGEDPPGFIRRVYGEWIGHGLTKADIRHLDPKLYEHLYSWLKKNTLPADLPLPTLKELNDELARQLQSDPGADGEDFRKREMRRLSGLTVRTLPSR